jgi:hypothetical protein
VSMNWDPLGKAVIEARADAGIAAIVGIRVSGFEPKKEWIKGPGEYVAHVVLVVDGIQRMRRVPIQRPRLVARCVGRTPEEAAALGVAVSNAFHDQGGRVHANGLGIYRSFADSGGDQDKDPDTDQPFVTVFIDLIATTQAVA